MLRLHIAEKVRGTCQLHPISTVPRIELCGSAKVPRSRGVVSRQCKQPPISKVSFCIRGLKLSGALQRLACVPGRNVVGQRRTHRDPKQQYTGREGENKERNLTRYAVKSDGHAVRPWRGAHVQRRMATCEAGSWMRRIIETTG